MSGYYPSPPYGTGPTPPSSSTSSSQQPDFSAVAAAVGRMGVDELRGLLEDDAKCEQFIKGLDQIRALYSEKEMLMASNKSLAEYNLSQEEPLRAARCKLQEKHRETKRAAEKVRLLRGEAANGSAAGGAAEPDTMLALLQAAGAEADEESEAVADKFLKDGETDVDEFLKQFMEKRKLAHTRRIKIDKMKELLEQRRKGGGGSQSSPYPGSAAAAPYYPSPASSTSSPYSASATPARRAPAVPSMPAVYNPPPPAANGSWGGSAAPPPAYPPPQAASSNLPYPIHPMGMPSGPGY